MLAFFIGMKVKYDINYKKVTDEIVEVLMRHKVEIRNVSILFKSIRTLIDRTPVNLSEIIKSQVSVSHTQEQSQTEHE